jgi:hypothetical protein
VVDTWEVDGQVKYQKFATRPLHHSKS